MQPREKPLVQRVQYDACKISTAAALRDSSLPPAPPIARQNRRRDAQRTYTLTDAEGATDLLEITTKAEGRTFVLDGSKMLTLYECSFYEGKLGYQVWPAALAGAAWACKNKALFEGKRVLELGSGVGLFGCAIAVVTDATTSR